MRTLLKLYGDAYRGLPREVWLLSCVMLVNRSGTMVVVFLSLYLTRELGFSLTTAGQVLSIYGLGNLAGAFLGGWLCDRLGALRIQVLSLVLSGLAFLVLEHLRTLPTIMLMVFLASTAAEALRPANGAALAAFSPPHLQTRAVALNRMAVNLGFSVGPALGGWLASHDYAWIFRVDGATCVAAGLLCMVLFRNLGPTTDANANANAGEDLHPLRDGVFLVFLVLVTLFCISFFQGWSTWPVYMNEAYGLDEAGIGLLLMLNAVLVFTLEMVVAHQAERFRTLTVIGAGSFLVAISLAILPLGTSVLLAVVSISVWTFGEMLAVPFAGGWVARRAGAVHRGKYMGLYTMAWGVAFVIGPAGGTWVYQRFGADVLWFGIGALGVLSWLGFEMLRKMLDRRAAAEPVLAVSRG